MAIIKFCLSLIALGIVNVDGRLQGNANSKKACRMSQMGYALFVPFEGEGCDVNCVDGLQKEFISAEAFEIAASSQFQAVYSNDLCNCLPQDALMLEFEKTLVSFSSLNECTPHRCLYEYRALKNTEQAFITADETLLEQRSVGMNNRFNYKLTCVPCMDTPDKEACRAGENTVKMPKVHAHGFLMVEFLDIKDKVSPKGTRSLYYHVDNIKKRDQMISSSFGYQSPAAAKPSLETKQGNDGALALFHETDAALKTLTDKLDAIVDNSTSSFLVSDVDGSNITPMYSVKELIEMFNSKILG